MEKVVDIETKDDKNCENDIDLLTDDNLSDEEMPEAFWVTQEEVKSNEISEDVILSFDEQIDALLSTEEDMKIKKLVA